jgi:hypothetical protein
MCPVCFGSVAWLITGGVSGLGATVGGVAIVRDRKIAARISKIWKLGTREPLPSGLFKVPRRLAVQERIGTGETHGQEQCKRHAAPQRTSRN